MKIKNVVVLGANGTMGRNIVAIFASFGKADVYVATRSMEKSQFAIEKAYKSIRCESIKKRLIPVTYDDIASYIPKCDLIFESLTEDFKVKEEMFLRIKPYVKESAIIASGTSGLSISKLAKVFDEKSKDFYGIHMFNPPYSLTLCELIGKENRELEEYLSKELNRTVVKVKDSPAFLGNRIGFFIINHALKLAEENMDQGGIDYIDSIMGGYTGRSMAPIVTADFVGLDVHKFIVDYIYENSKDENFMAPTYLNKLIYEGNYGEKSQKGLYYYDEDRNLQFVYDIKDGKYRIKNNYNFYFANEMINKIKVGDYKKAYDFLINDECTEAVICKRILLEYIVYSLKISNEVSTIEACDDAMATGFSWIPPIALIDVFGGKNNVESLVNKYLSTDFISYWNEIKAIVPTKSKYDYRTFLKAKY